MDAELAERIVALATRAPSVHNTQPWRFVATTTALDIHADRTRQLIALDPTGRQLTMSCGAALGLARLAVAGLGYACSVELLPDPDDADHLARLTIGRPVPVDAGDLALVREIGRRRTVRERFDAIPLSPSERATLDRAAEAQGASLRWLDTVRQRAALAVLTDRAERVERADPAIRVELARWLRPDGTAADGIPPDALPDLPYGLRSSDVPLRDFPGADTDATNADPQHLPLPVERPDLAVLCTPHDGRADWLRAGQALVRVLLRATALELAASPLGQALDLPWTRQLLQVELGVGGPPQLILRVGHARPGGPVTARRPVAEVLTTQ